MKMGDNFLKRQAKNFRERRDQALEKAKRPLLFSRPDDVNQLFLGKPCPNERYTDGEKLWAILEPKVNQITLVRQHKKIGFIDGEGANILKGALTKNEGPGIIPMYVRRVLDLSQVAQLEIAEEIRNEQR
jgi:hypothetical protein